MVRSTWSRTAVVALLVGVLVFGAIGPAAAMPHEPRGPASATADSASHLGTADTAATADLEMVQQLGLTPSRPGEITVTTRFSVPSNVVSLETGIPPAATVVSTEGFVRRSTTEYHWNGRDRTPSLTYRMPANRTMEATGPIAGSGDFLYVDPGPWALVAVPRTPVSWSWRGEPRVQLARQTTIDGPGAVGEAIAFLGEHRELTRTAHGQTFRLIVPAAASLAEPPERLFDSLTAASDTLRVGDRDAEVFIVAAPTGSVRWAVRGFQTGPADAWVRDAERLDTADNVWLHEYVHTRQGYEAGTGVQWFTEASASYYATLLALEQGHIDFDAFAARLAQGTRKPDRNAVLVDPTTWDVVAPYTKGALVAGELDRQLRLATDRRRSLQDVFVRMNAHEGTVERTTFQEFVRASGGAEVATLADRYTSTRDVPSTWDLKAHGAAFATVPARISYAVADDTGSVRVSGPYRSGAIGHDQPVVLVPGETLAVDVVVSNTGGAVGEYDAALRVDGELVDHEPGSLPAGESRVVTLAHQFDALGEYRVTGGGREVAVSVRPLSTPRVIDLTAVETGPATDGRVAVVLTAQVRNDADRPAAADLTLSKNGTAVETRRVELAPGEDGSVTFDEVSLEPGVHGFRVDGASVTVTVGQTNTEPTLRVEGDGFGPVVALIALFGLVILLGRRP